MRDTITHLAGPVVSVRGRIVQRCMVCGDKLCDNANTAMPLNPDGTQPVFPTWEIGKLIQTEDGNPRRWSMIGSFMDDPLPEDFCIESVEA